MWADARRSSGESHAAQAPAPAARPSQTSGAAPNNWYEKKRLGGLRRFAAAITALNLFGHAWLGFEQAWLVPLVSLATAYAVELLLETIECWSRGRRPRFLGVGLGGFVDFLLSAHISGLAVAMLTFTNENLTAVCFGATAAIASKHVFRAPLPGGGTRHFLNPSNFGITATLLTLDWVGMVPPYQFTENLGRVGDFLLPCVIICLGSLLNTLFTERLPLIFAWLFGFVAQAVIRTSLEGTMLSGALLPMSGVAFILFTFYMVTDPATTPTSPRGQVAFGLSVALTYGLLVANHVVYTLFVALTLVTAARGVLLHVAAWAAARRPVAVEALPTT